MKKFLSLCLVGCMSGALLFTGGCSSSGVSQEEYDKVVAELNDLKEQMGITDTVSTNNTTTEDTNNQSVSSSEFDEDAVISSLKVSEYSYMSGNTPWHFLVVENTSDFDLRLSASLKTYDNEDNLLSANEDTQNAVEHGTKTIFSFMLDEPFAKTEYEFSASPEETFRPVISNLSYESTSAKEKEILSVTNNGKEPAAFVEATMLFFKGNTLVKHGKAFFTDEDYELKPGETISQEINCSKDYDSYQVYFTGRASN